MAIKFSSNAIDKVLLGNTEIDKLYLGENSIYEKTPSTGETWVINENINAPSTTIRLQDLSFNYKLFNGSTIMNLNIGTNFTVEEDEGEITLIYGVAGGANACEKTGSTVEWSSVYGDYYSWEDLSSAQKTQLRTIVFNTAPTGDLLTWLNANATKL